MRFRAACFYGSGGAWLVLNKQKKKEQQLLNSGCFFTSLYTGNIICRFLQSLQILERKFF